MKCAVILGLAAITAVGCQAPPAPPPKNIPVADAPPPAPRPPTAYPADIPKPMPEQIVEPPAPAFDDPPLVDQRLPEEGWFVGVYNHVGQPQIAVFVNRTVDGAVIGEGPYATTTYLLPGQYDAALLQSLDYIEIESLLTDWLHCSGQVTLISPGFIRAHLNDDQVKNLQSGKASGLDDLTKATQADVLVQVQAHPVRRDNQLVVLIVAEAINVRGGESLAHASVEMPTPIDRIELNNYTRFLARKLMHEMANTWSNAPAPASQTPPATRP